MPKSKKSKSKSDSDFYLFNDNCLYTKDGKRARWSNILPILFILFLIIETGSVFYRMIKNRHYYKNVNAMTYILSGIFTLTFCIINIMIAINLSFYCNAFSAFIIYCLLSTFTSLIFSELFPTIKEINNKIQKENADEMLKQMNKLGFGESKCDCGS